MNLSRIMCQDSYGRKGYSRLDYPYRKYGGFLTPRYGRYGNEALVGFVNPSMDSGSSWVLSGSSHQPRDLTYEGHKEAAEALSRWRREY